MTDPKTPSTFTRVRRFIQTLSDAQKGYVWSFSVHVALLTIFALFTYVIQTATPGVTISMAFDDTPVLDQVVEEYDLTRMEEYTDSENTNSETASLPVNELTFESPAPKEDPTPNK